MRRTRTDPKSLDLTFPCPNCGYKIPPREIVLTDAENVKCPQCGKESVYLKRKS
jgi:predicted RNA-binding Zn-ribbon protein involved in translation (DUF1610 family)